MVEILLAIRCCDDGVTISGASGFQTDSSGTVDLRFHVVRQRQLRGPVDRTARPRSPQKTFKMAQALELSKSTMSVLSAFKRAHSRMQASKK